MAAPTHDRTAPVGAVAASIAGSGSGGGAGDGDGGARPTGGGGAPGDGPAPMSHRAVLESLSGLLLALLVAILSSTVVTTALPRIIADLGGGQSSYTWVVTSTLLAMTVSTPVWGKLADLFHRKTLVQVALVIYIGGSVLAGFSTSTTWLIACRVIQGLGVGGLTALVQVVLSDLVSPRERGRYMGYLGAVMAVGTVAGPLIGGVITDSVLGWRWCFFVGVPVAALALVTLQLKLKLPRRPPREVHIDYLGALLMAGGVSSLLIWVSLAGQQFGWASGTTALMVGGGLLLLVLAVLQMRRSPEPLIPLDLFGRRTVVLAVIASIAVGIAMFGTSVFLSLYLQVARGKSPTSSGLLTIPMVMGVMLSSTVIGRRITATGIYKRWMVLGGVLVIAGLAGMGTLDETTNLFELGGFMFLLGCGVGMLMQNLVLVVQNILPAHELGAGSALVAFFRSMGGAAGVSVLGAVLASKISSTLTEEFRAAGISAASLGSGDTVGSVPDLSQVPAQVRPLIEHAYGVAVGEIFLVAVPMGIVALIAVLFIKEIPLRTQRLGAMAPEREAEPVA